VAGLAIRTARWFLHAMPTIGFDLIALACLVPAALVRWRANDERDGWFLAVLVLAAAGPLLDVAMQFAGAWRTGFAASLWLTIAVTLILFWGLIALEKQSWRLTPILMPVLFLLGVLATVWQHDRGRPIATGVSAGWLDAHIVFAILTYGLITLAAVAGIAVLVQEQALKSKHRGGVARRLPPIADAERAEIQLLVGAELSLALNLLSGAGAEYLLRNSMMPLDHKIGFSLAAFVVLGALLVLRWRTGIRGRRAARWVLLAYLLLTLAYPGVKFVTDVLMA
jgi:ABC-type uncharacterized transport system permease subunit